MRGRSGRCLDVAFADVGDSQGTAPTGRLFRSLRAEGDAANAAVPALSLDQAVGLKSVTLGEPLVPEIPAAAPAPPAPSLLAPPSSAAPAPVAPAAAAGAPLAVAAVIDLPPSEDRFRPEDIDDRSVGSEHGAQRRGAHAATGVKASGVWLVVIGVTVFVAFADAIVVGRTGLGWLTGIALLASSIYGAVMVRRGDDLVAVIAPPIAFFLATITAGQLTLPAGSDLLVREAFMVVTTLGSNAPWIFGSTLVALAIVLLRRRRASRA